MLEFYKNKKVLVTGHTGFKGTWLCKVLINSGADVLGFSLEPNSDPNLFELTNIESKMTSVIGDIRNLNLLKEVFNEFQPEIVFHLAAQPLVRESYINPVHTFETNILGTVNVLECIRLSQSVKSVVNITTDKVYKNKEWEWGYRENEELFGRDPYSNSKSCSELITQSYIDSFFQNREVSISTARAGNVIGGGDFSTDRIIPDCIRAVTNNKVIEIRNPLSTRPYQHVLEPIFAYLLIAKEQYENKRMASNYNVGPNDEDCVNTEKLVEIFCQKWGKSCKWTNLKQFGPHEANFLKLDCSKFKKSHNWNPRWDIYKAIELTVQWTNEYLQKNDVNHVMDYQISEYVRLGSQ